MDDRLPAEPLSVDTRNNPGGAPYIKPDYVNRSLYMRVLNRLQLVLWIISAPRKVRQTADEVRSRRLTYLSRDRLLVLAALCVELEKQRAPGIIIEAGCALGGSGIVLCSAKARGRQLFLYDVFSMIPPPDKQDGPDVHARYKVIRAGKATGIGGDTYYGYVDDLYSKVKMHFSDFHMSTDDNDVHLVKGLVQDTLHVEQPVCLAHIDVDWYEAVRICLERIEPWVIEGGSIVIDDYRDWSGCRTAVDEYFSKNEKLYRFMSPAGSLIVTKRQTSSRMVSGPFM